MSITPQGCPNIYNICTVVAPGSREDTPCGWPVARGRGGTAPANGSVTCFCHTVLDRPGILRQGGPAGPNILMSEIVKTILDRNKFDNRNKLNIYLVQLNLKSVYLPVVHPKVSKS